MKRVLVTGANGFVGGHLVKELHTNGFEVTGVGGHEGKQTNFKYISSYKLIDLKKTLAMEINFNEIDYVIHLAGLASVGPSFDRPMDYINTNMGIEINLFETAIKQRACPKFLVVSSGALYDPNAHMPLTETSAILPNSPYAISKLGQEQISAYYKTRGFDCIIARPFNHIGPGQSLGFILPDLVKQVVDVKKGFVQSVKVGNLKTKRDYTDVRDIARAYRLLMERGESGEVYNICSGIPQSGYELLSKSIHTAGIEAKVNTDRVSTRPTDSYILYGSHEKITLHTGWKPVISIDKTIADVLDDWSSRI